MNTALLEAMIVNRLEADTGTGGLFDIAGAIVSQVYNGFANPADVLDKPHDEANIAAVREKVAALTRDFPVYR